MFRGFKSVCWGIVVLVGSVTIAWNSYKLYRHFVPVRMVRTHFVSRPCNHGYVTYGNETWCVHTCTNCGATCTVTFTDTTNGAPAPPGTP
jgi:hypothetical protein